MLRNRGPHFLASRNGRGFPVCHESFSSFGGELHPVNQSLTTYLYGEQPQMKRVAYAVSKRE
jgi:hypothetical protein